MNDDDIKSLIARSDPARSLAPATPDEKRLLMETAMTTIKSPMDEAARRRSPRRTAGIFGGLAVAAAAVVAVAIVLPLSLGSASAPTALQLPSTGGPTSDCAPVSAETIATADTAFRGRVTGIADGLVTLEVTDRFAGDPGSTVEVAQGEDTAVDGAPITFIDGTTYLIAATDGMVLTCGSSAEDSPQLDAIYEEAFPS